MTYLSSPSLGVLEPELDLDDIGELAGRRLMYPNFAIRVEQSARSILFTRISPASEDGTDSGRGSDSEVEGDDSIESESSVGVSGEKSSVRISGISNEWNVTHPSRPPHQVRDDSSSPYAVRAQLSR
jgi:hypothetical protein